LKCTPTLGSLEKIATAVNDLMKDQFIAELAQYMPRLAELQRRTILANVHRLATLRRAA